MDSINFISGSPKKINGRALALFVTLVGLSVWQGTYWLERIMDSSIVPKKSILPRDGYALEKTVLESVPLNQISVVGILLGNGSPWAIVKSETTPYQIVKINNLLGIEHEQIIGITDNAIQLQFPNTGKVIEMTLS